MTETNQPPEVSEDGMSGSENKSDQLNFDRSQHRFECRGCGFIYDYMEGVKKFDIPAGTSFFDLDRETFKCPVCRAGIDAFRDIGPRSQPSGFSENFNYGLGVNKLSPGQKNILIFGGLAFALACFLSLYSLN